jgi:hypothetical protein
MLLLLRSLRLGLRLCLRPASKRLRVNVNALLFLLLCFRPCSISDSSVAGFLRKAFSERSQKLLSGSLKAPDGAALQAVLGKLNEEEKAREYIARYRYLSAAVMLCV